MRDTLSLVAASYEHSGIAVEVMGDASVTTRGFPNEYSQVLLNLLSNARDALIERRTSSRRVTIDVDGTAAWCVVTVTDNAGGVEVEPVDRVFEPYFTTKATGTGVGLYMSKKIIEDSMGGYLTVANGTNGAMFSITTPSGGSPHVE